MKREELQHDFHNEQGINWLNSQGEPDIDYVMWLENKILAIKNNTPLPPAEGAELDHQHDHPLDHSEGAEEILPSISHTIELIEDEVDSLKDAYKKALHNPLKREYSTAILSHKTALRLLKGNATLHALRLAEKMVEEKLMEELIKYDKHYWGHHGDSKKEVDAYLEYRKNLKSKEQ